MSKHIVEGDGIWGNPNPDFFVTVTGFESIEHWATHYGFTLDDALEEGVCADDGNDDIYVPKHVHEQTLSA